MLVQSIEIIQVIKEFSLFRITIDETTKTINREKQEKMVKCKWNKENDRISRFPMLFSDMK